VIRAQDVDRRGLRAALVEVAPWVTATDHGPSAVEAGDCERCGNAPRLLPLCGPVAWTAVCRDCGLALGEDGWCDGHRDDGAAARAWAAALADDWPLVTLLWWLATGELRSLEVTADQRQHLSPALAAALPSGR